MRVLHLIRAAGDTLAWDAVRARGPGDEVRVVLLQEAVGDMPPADLKDVAVGLLLPRGRRSGVGVPASLVEASRRDAEPPPPQ